MRSTRYVVTAGAVAAASFLPVQAAHAVSHCFGRPVDFMGTKSTDTQGVDSVASPRSVFHMGAGKDRLYVNPGTKVRTVACLGDGDDQIDGGGQSADGTIPWGAIVSKVDGGAGKDTAQIAACFTQPFPLGSINQAIEVRNVERIIIVPCGSDFFD